MCELVLGELCIFYLSEEIIVWFKCKLFDILLNCLNLVFIFGGNIYNYYF